MYCSYVRRLFHSLSFSSTGESLSLDGSGLAMVLPVGGDAELVVCEVTMMPVTGGDDNDADCPAAHESLARIHVYQLLLQ